MRVLKFRAWNTDMNEMVHFSGIQFDPNSPKEIPHIIDQNNDVYYMDEIELMQFTGITDKNGKEIFEGDKVSLFCDGNIYRKWKDKEVVFVDGAFGFFWKISILSVHSKKTQERFQPFCNIDWDIMEVEVVGNIYEGEEKP